MTETAAIKSEVQTTIALIKKIDQGQRSTIESLKSEVKILKRGVIDAPHLERWSEYTDSAITLVLELLDEWMNHLEINANAGGGGVGIGITYIEAFLGQVRMSKV